MQCGLLQTHGKPHESVLGSHASHLQWAMMNNQAFLDQQRDMRMNGTKWSVWPLQASR